MNIKKFIINQLNKSDRNVNLTQENLKQKQYKDNIDNKEKINEIIDELGAIDGDISNINNDIATINTGLNGKVSKSGDTMTGILLINNLNEFDGVKKIRKIDEDNYSITVAIGADKAGKVQYQKNGTTINGIQLKEDGTIWNEKTNKRLLENTIIVSAAGENLNNYQNTGLYYFSNSPANIPVGSNGWLLVIAGYNANTITKQIWLRHGTINSNDFEIYVRTYSGSWGNWNRLITEVESGSNSNGSYRKYSDGTMECWGTKTSTINISTSYEGSYFGGINGINFPASFISAPQVTCTLQQGSALLGVNLSGASASGFNVYIWKQQSKNNVSVTLNYRAIGKWK